MEKCARVNNGGLVNHGSPIGAENGAGCRQLIVNPSLDLKLPDTAPLAHDTGKQSDLEYVAKKLQTLQTQNAQRVMQELAPQAQEVLREIIETDQIGLLLQQQAVIHADLGYNITAKVSDKMNQLGIE